ncbi:hypothetical protein KM043_010916 [Ampulex compressa]|nr:hypothetical protein KM043_010916 [Ampulex compressa]
MPVDLELDQPDVDAAKFAMGAARATAGFHKNVSALGGGHQRARFEPRSQSGETARSLLFTLASRTPSPSTRPTPSAAPPARNYSLSRKRAGAAEGSGDISRHGRN